jgi:hypothetical protein
MRKLRILRVPRSQSWESGDKSVISWFALRPASFLVGH